MQQTEQASKQSKYSQQQLYADRCNVSCSTAKVRQQTWLHRTFQHYTFRCLCTVSQSPTAETHHHPSPSLTKAVKLLLSPHQRHLTLAAAEIEALPNPYLWFSFLVLLSLLLSPFHCYTNPAFLLMLYSFICPLFSFAAIYLLLLPLSLTTTCPAATHCIPLLAASFHYCHIKLDEAYVYC
jgi:hypothetical protein